MSHRNPFALALLLALAAAVAFGCATGTPPPAPAAAQAEAAFEPFHSLVDAAFVKQHIQMPMAEDVMIIDSRPRRPKYEEGHIPMAVSLPDSQFAKLAGQLPANKDALLVFYCGGLACPLSHKSARKAEALGYTNVKVFAEGMPGWLKVKGNYASVSVEWLQKQLQADTGLVVVDSRPRRTQYDKGHIPGALSIPDSEFAQLASALPADKAAALVFYCGGLKCPLSHKSAEKAMALGYTNVMVFADGYPAWTAHTQEAAGAPMKAGKAEGTIDTDNFVQMVTETPERLYLVDVRDPEEFARGSFRSAVNIPVEQLEAKMGSLPQDRPVVFVCNTGARSGESFYMVQDLKPGMKNVYYLDAEVTYRKDGTFEIKKPTS
jgi:rhodanese-related sulfurtransferase